MCLSGGGLLALMTLIIACGLTACMSPHPAASHVVLVPVERNQTKQVKSKDAAAIAALLRSTEEFEQLSEKRQRRVLRQTETRYSRDYTPDDRLRLGLIHALRGTPADRDRALELLGGLDWVDGHYGYGMLARLVSSLLDEQKALSKRAGDEDRALSAERVRRKQLRKKLDALKAIEKSISDRDNSKGPP